MTAYSKNHQQSCTIFTLLGLSAISLEKRNPFMKHMLISTLVIFLIQGCATIGHKKFYTQVAPTKYPSTEKVLVFEYADVNLKDVYDLLFSDFLIIGRSGFTGPYQTALQSASFARSIGADIFLSTSQFRETRTSFINRSTPTSNTTFVSGYSGSDAFYGTATTYGTRITTIPITINRYDQEGLFLRNVNNVNPLWERTDAQYKKTGSSELDGIWFDENYKINVYRSGQQIVAFIDTFVMNTREQRIDWKQGQLKFVYGIDSGVGVYLMSNKKPEPAKIGLNKFGHLQISLISTGNTFSFARQ